MLNGDEIWQEITSAQRGSDIHGLVEKIAYFLYLRRSNRVSADTNWYDAQDILVGWTQCDSGRGLRNEPSFERAIYRSIDQRAYEIYRKKASDLNTDDYDMVTPHEDWMTAQHELAKQVLEQECGIEV